MVSEKTRTFIFCEISILWSSLRRKFMNLRFEDFRFFRIFVNILKTKKSSAENFFIPPKIFFIRKFLRKFWIFFQKLFFGRKLFCAVLTFLFVQTFFFFWKKKTENGSNCLCTSPNFWIKSRMLWPLLESSEVFCWQLHLFRRLLFGSRGKKACYTLLPDSSCFVVWIYEWGEKFWNEENPI